MSQVTQGSIPSLHLQKDLYHNNHRLEINLEDMWPPKFIQHPKQSTEHEGNSNKSHRRESFIPMISVEKLGQIVICMYSWQGYEQSRLWREMSVTLNLKFNISCDQALHSYSYSREYKIDVHTKTL